MLSLMISHLTTARRRRIPMFQLITVLSRLLLALLLMARPAAAQTDTVITFDTVPSGTVIDTYYQNMGVTFAVTFDPHGTTITGGHIYARDAADAESPPNVVTLVPPYSSTNPSSSIFSVFDASSGAVKATFNTLQTSVSIDAETVLGLESLGPLPAGPFLEAFDASGHLLGQTVYPIMYGAPNYGTWQRLTFTSTTNNIAYILFSAQYDQAASPVFGEFDRLEFKGPAPSPQSRLVPSQYATIQDAISAANSGDTVQVANGTYTGPGNVNLDFGGKAITVQGQSEYGTVIDCQNAPATRGVYFHSGEGVGAVFEDFTVQNGNEADGNVGTGGGIFVTNASSPTIRNCFLNKDAAEYGGGAGVNTSSSPTITDCLFDGDTAANTGGAVFIYQNCNPALVNDVFFRNAAGGGIGGNGAGGALEIYAGSAPIITGCSFSQNSAGNSGGGVHLGAGSVATVTNTILYGDTAPDGEIGLNGGTTITVNHSDVQQSGGTYSGTGNINADPRYYLPPSDVVVFLALSLTASPCVGQGTSSAPDYLNTDILGTMRPASPSMGAFEGTSYTASTAISVSSSADPSPYGLPPTFKATVTETGGSAVPTGAVQFYDNTILLGVPQNLVNGTAILTPASLHVGSHNITAAYLPGIAPFPSSYSAALVQVVNSATAGSPVLTITNIKLTASGGTVTLTALVSNSGVNAATGVQITAATLSPSAFGSNPRPVSASSLPGPFVIPAAQSHPITLTFTTTMTGRARLKISGTAAGGLAFSYGTNVNVP